MRSRNYRSLCLAFVFVLALPTFTHAAGSGLRFEHPIQWPADLLTGPVLQGLIIHLRLDDCIHYASSVLAQGQ
jgi:hypothetical protein